RSRALSSAGHPGTGDPTADRLCGNCASKNNAQSELRRPRHRQARERDEGRMRRIVIAGTGTGVGKSYVTAKLREAFAASCPTVALKPVESGYDPEWSDARIIGGDGWQP